MALAKAAAARGVPFVLTSTSITPMEEIAQQSGANLWFQLYPWVEEDDTMALIRKARGPDRRPARRRARCRRRHRFQPWRAGARQCGGDHQHPA
jgi:hypothetical protein